jgi:hypothetical protein
MSERNRPLIGGEPIEPGHWRAALEAAESAIPGGLSSEGRKAILVDAFAANLADYGNYA